MGRPPKWSKPTSGGHHFVCGGHWLPVAGFAPSVPALEHGAPLPSDLEPRRDLGEDRGPSPGSGTGRRRPRAGPVGVGYRRSKRSGGPLSGSSTRGSPPRRYRDVKRWGWSTPAVVAAIGWDSSRGPLPNPGASRRYHRQRIQEILRHPLLQSGITSQVVNRVSASFEVLPRRWVVERTWAWLVNHRRLRIDYERDPAVAEGFVWAAHARVLLRRLTQRGPNPTRRAN